MNKTIEEAAREATRKEYLCESCVYKGDCDLCGGQNTAFDCCECSADSYEDGFKAGAAHFMSLPLASRMTKEEKEKIQEQYDEVRIFTENIDPCGETSEYYFGQKVILERIFGKELFERKEE